MSETVENSDTTEKVSFQTFYQYVKKDSKKIGVCKLCKTKNILKEVPMANSNTSGLKKSFIKLP